MPFDFRAMWEAEIRGSARDDLIARFEALDAIADEEERLWELLDIVDDYSGRGSAERPMTARANAAGANAAVANAAGANAAVANAAAANAPAANAPAASRFGAASGSRSAAEAGRDLPFAVAVGRRIRAERALAGLTQKQLAEATSLSHPALSRLETGARTLSFQHACRIADALGVAVERLRPPHE